MKNKKLNILITIESFFDGGAEMFAIRLANELAHNHNVFFLELYPYITSEKNQLKLLDQENVRLIQPGRNMIGDWLYSRSFTEKYSRIKSGGKAGKIYKRLKKLEIGRLIRKHKIQVVNSHSWDSDVYFANLKKTVPFWLVSSFHGHYELLPATRQSFEHITSTCLHNTDEVVYTSPQHLATLNHYKFPAEKRHKIFYAVPMSIATTPTAYKHNNVLVLVMVARPIKEKGWEEAILAVVALNNIYPGKLKLLLVGGGPYLEALQKKYKQSFISFTGYTNDVPNILQHAHVGLLPSYFAAESLPNSVIEYLVCGKPVVATNAGAIAEMLGINNKVAGTCIPLINGKVSVESIIAAIRLYLEDNEKVKAHSILALQAAEKFSMNNCVENYLGVFTASIAGNSASAP